MLLFSNIPTVSLLSFGSMLYCLAFIAPDLCNGFVPGISGFKCGYFMSSYIFPYPILLGIVFTLIFIFIGGLITNILGLDN